MMVSVVFFAEAETLFFDSFESITLGDGCNSANGYIPGWAASGIAAVWNPITTPGGPDSHLYYVPDGNNIAYLNAGAWMSKTLGVTLTENTVYTLSVELGHRLDHYFPGCTIQLYAGGVLIAEDDDTVVPPAGEFATATISYSVSLEDDNLGQPLKIQFLTDGTQSVFDCVSLTTEPNTPPWIDIDIDIKPGSDKNPINLKSKGIIPVAILTTEEFDVSDIDIDTVLIGDRELGGVAVPVASKMEDIDGDGDIDILLKFSIQELVAGEAINEASIELEITGATDDGILIVGSDTVTVVPGSSKGKAKGKKK